MREQKLVDLESLADGLFTAGTVNGLSNELAVVGNSRLQVLRSAAVVASARTRGPVFEGDVVVDRQLRRPMAPSCPPPSLGG